MDSGQVFGFAKSSESAYTGCVYGVPVRLSKSGGRLSVHFLEKERLSPEDIRHYFHLDYDSAELEEILEGDQRLKPALRAYAGLRILRQDPWEALACFIISSNNNVKRIQHIWRSLAVHFDKSLRFPSAQAIARSHEKILRSLGLGYRAPFLLETARFVARNPEYLTFIRDADYLEARERVLKFAGIGPKVADCVLLYGFQKPGAFPVDVWIRRVMRKLYFGNRRISEARIQAFAQNKWRHHAGYVQQYLFHAAKNGVL